MSVLPLMQKQLLTSRYLKRKKKDIPSFCRSSLWKYTQGGKKKILFHSFSSLQEITNLLLGTVNIKGHKACEMLGTVSVHCKCSINYYYLFYYRVADSEILPPLEIWTSHDLMPMSCSQFKWKSLPLANEIPFSLQINLNVYQE